jgi:zinc protease
MGRTTFPAILLLSCSNHTPPEAPADQQGLVGVPLDEVLPSDPGVQMGTLDNGLRWYVEENHKPKKRAELRLVIKAGSVLEDDDQLGLAHFLEHMAFNGTENYAENDLIAYMESIGMAFGADVNASTGFDKTLYKLTVPTDRPELLEQGLQVLRDQGGAMLLDPVEIDKERGVVLEEWRTRRGAQGRIVDQMVLSTFEGSRYAERLPIGTEDSIRGFEPDALRRFYQDWYRPDLMAVMAVGDFDPQEVIGLIENHFSDWKGPEDPRPRPDVEIPARAEPVVTVITDPEVPRTLLELSDQFDEAEGQTYGDYRSNLVRRLFFGVVNERLSTLARQPDAPFLGAGAGPSRLNATEVSTSLGAACPEGRVTVAIDALWTEVQRAQRHGVTEAELERARHGILSRYEQIEREIEKTSSSSHIAELVRVFTHDEAMPGTALEVQLAETWVPQISKEEVDAVAAEWMQRGSLVLQVVMPEKEGLDPPDEAQLSALLAEVESRDVAAMAEQSVDQPLLDPLPPEGASVVDRGELPELGVITWTLSNGVEVWLKPTDFKDDEIRLQARSRGGRALVPDADYVIARSAPGIRAKSGVGAFDPPTLSKRLTGVRASASTSIHRFGERLSGSCSPDELETMLQLLTLQFTQPVFTERGLIQYRQSKEESLRNRLSDPDNVFDDAYDRIMYGDHLRSRSWTVETLEQLDLARSEAFYQARFADAADFHWVIVGNLDLETMEPLIVRYLGALPAAESREEVGDDGMSRVSGRHTDTVHAGIEPKAKVKMTWHGAFESTWINRNRIQALEDILDVRLREVIREDLGGTYGVSTSSGTWEEPTHGYRFTITFRCDPERVDELRAAALAEVALILGEAPTAEEITTEQEKNRRDREERVRTNGFWSSGIASTLERGEDPRELVTWDARNDSLSADEVHAMAARVFSEDANYVELVLLPEEQ